MGTHHIARALNNIDKLRTERMQVAVNKKFPKLAAWKADDGAKSILVLEQNDVHLTNASTVADIYLPLAKARPDRPNETHLVASCCQPID